MIIPVTQTRTVHCIIEQGIRYCEDTNLSKNEIGAGLLIVVGIALVMGGAFWIGSILSDKYDNFALLILSVLTPLFIAGIILLLL